VPVLTGSGSIGQKPVLEAICGIGGIHAGVLPCGNNHGACARGACHVGGGGINCKNQRGFGDGLDVFVEWLGVRMVGFLIPAATRDAAKSLRCLAWWGAAAR
jgi:hypothetical protein